MSATHRLFVYGNLLLEGLTHLGPAVTRGGYKLVERGPLAGLVLGGMDKVHGELYELNTQQLGTLDLAREHQRLY